MSSSLTTPPTPSDTALWTTDLSCCSGSAELLSPDRAIAIASISSMKPMAPPSDLATLRSDLK